MHVEDKPSRAKMTECTSQAGRTKYLIIVIVVSTLFEKYYNKVCAPKPLMLTLIQPQTTPQMGRQLVKDLG